MAVQTRRSIQAVLGALLALALLAGIGCERRSDAQGYDPRTAGTLVITSDFGGSRHPGGRIAAGASVMDGLRATTPVRTAYGGGFVAEMYGLESDPGGRDWFYWVNGRLADRGAREVAVAAGDLIWWDHHPWSTGIELSAVVGAWPVPFVFGDRVRVVADPPFRAWLRNLGGRVVDESPWRIRVGSVERLRRVEPDWARANDDGALPALIDEDGVRLLGADGTSMVAVPDAAAVAVAIPARGAIGIVLLVVGKDAGAAARAGMTIRRDLRVLSGRVAVAFDAAGTPVGSAGLVS